MRCAEKEELQHNCSAAWDAYASRVKELGLPVDPQSRTVKTPLIGEWFAWRSAGGLILRDTFLEAIRLRGDHLRASRELSAHLSRHRC